MPITLTINSIPYEYPIAGDSPGWGQPATDWASGVTAVLNDLLGADDITETTFAVANNVLSFTPVAGLAFNTGTVRAATITYSVYRYTASATSGHAESGTINIVYDNNAAPGSLWAMTSFGVTGNAGVTFSITDGGQVQYKSTNIAGANYSGNLHFRATSLGQ